MAIDPNKFKGSFTEGFGIGSGPAKGFNADLNFNNQREQHTTKTGAYASKPHSMLKKGKKIISGFDVDEFRSKIGSNLARPTYFRVMIGATFFQTEEVRLLSFLCNQAQLPARQFATIDYATHGPIMKMPYQNMYDDVVMSFYCKEDMGVKTLFQQWQNKIVHNYGSNEFQYLDDYKASIAIIQYNEKGDETYVVRLEDAYPLMVSPLQMDWSTRDTYHNLQVTIAYRYWRELKPAETAHASELNPLFPNLEFSLSDFDNIGAVGSVNLENGQVNFNPLDSGQISSMMSRERIKGSEWGSEFRTGSQKGDFNLNNINMFSSLA